VWPPQPAPAARVANTTLGRDDLELLVVTASMILASHSIQG